MAKKLQIKQLTKKIQDDEAGGVSMEPETLPPLQSNADTMRNRVSGVELSEVYFSQVITATNFSATCVKAYGIKRPKNLVGIFRCENADFLIIRDGYPPLHVCASVVNSYITLADQQAFDNLDA